MSADRSPVLSRWPRVAALPLLGMLASPELLAASPPGPGLEGTDWQLREYQADGEPRPALGERPALLHLEDGRLSGTLGCNRLHGAYRTEGDRLSFDRHMASTMMACPPDLMAQEQAAVAALEQVAGFHVANGTLTLNDADGKPLLTFALPRGRTLTGVRWRLTNYNNGRQAVVTIANGTSIALQIGDDGQFAGRACNNFRGRFDITEGGLSLVGGIAATRMLCPEPPEASPQEAAFFQSLERVARWRIEGDRLTLRDADGATLAIFVAE